MRIISGSLIVLFFLLTAIVSVPGQSSGQKHSPTSTQSEEKQCPKLAVEALPLEAMKETTLKFRVLLDGIKARRDLRFDWTAVSGTITAGQTKPTVTIDTQGSNANDLLVTVAVGGLPPNCPATVSFKPPPPILCFAPFDTFGVLESEDEKARLDTFAVALHNDPTVLGYIIVYGGRRGRRGEAQAGADRARLYLINERGVDNGSIVMVEGGFREETTFEVFLVPPKAAPPTATPTIDERDVEFTDHTP